MFTNELVVIKENQEILGKEFTIYSKKGVLLFLAKDVADWIEHQDPHAMVRMVDEEEKAKISPVLEIRSDLKPNNAGYWFLTEDGVYEVLMQSTKPIAKQFKKEVKKILKEIRNTGGYIPNSKDASDEEIVANALEVARRIIERKDKQLKEQKPLVEFAETVSGSADSIDVGQLAKLANDESIPIGRNRLFDWLRSKSYLRHNNEPYQKYIDLGWFEYSEKPYKNAYGYTGINMITLVTGRGQIAIIERLRKSFNNNEDIEFFQMDDE